MGGVVLEGCCRCEPQIVTKWQKRRNKSYYYSFCYLRHQCKRSKLSVQLISKHGNNDTSVVMAKQDLHKIACFSLGLLHPSSHLFCSIVLWCTDWGAGFGCRDGAGEDWISAWHVKTRLCDLSTTGFPLGALEKRTWECLKTLLLQATMHVGQCTGVISIMHICLISNSSLGNWIKQAVN